MQKIVGCESGTENASRTLGGLYHFCRFRPSQTLLSIVIHRIHALAPILPLTQCYQGLVWRQQWPWEGIPPVNTQPRTRDLHPALDVAHGGQLPGEDLAQQEVDPRYAQLRKLLLDERHRVGIALPPERTQDEAPFLGRLGRVDGLPPQVLHLVVTVRLVRQLA